jgi:hypothetical protein
MLRAFEQGGIFYRATPAMTRDLGFTVSPEGLSHLVASCNTQGDVEDLSSLVTHYDGGHTFEWTCGDSHQNIRCIQN